MAEPLADPVAQTRDGHIGGGQVDLTQQVFATNRAEDLCVDHVWRPMVRIELKTIEH